ncbi:uncharacterized protein LOC125179354 [Hyalella azteca]|uniref:Uncharacterized protein LOC125179354 n=1 Tax=Hyalella azteca TaxID=294128 RepID=A0A979FUU8_HYAAZ|nr:uncharacterized protein LOC125179354 [Hyalella azteca]
MYQTVNQLNERHSCINFVLDPQICHPDPLSSILDDRSVEGHIEKLFDLETIGIKEDDPASNSDQIQIEEFSNSIEKVDGQYQVSLPWDKDKLALVNDGFAVSRAVVERVIKNLDSKGKLADYHDVFQQQLRDGIIEEIPLHSSDESERVYIPHRAVIREDPNVTTKIRPVLNCSLKVGKNPSLNEAAFPGVDLMNDLLGILIKVRCDNYLVMSDVKKAFLQIKLASVKDRNKFCILWKVDGRLVVYRYKTIVFGFVSSPFILNYLVKHHVKNYPQDLCSQFLSETIYVDNLFMTGNSPEQVLILYKQAYERMLEAGFDLGSWSSNCEELVLQCQRDGRAADHGTSHEKLLGYHYLPRKDKLTVVVDHNLNPLCCLPKVKLLL